uniref:Iota-conotoxin-like L11.5 n=1 Tax=Conus lynceus TaxID=289038 RepID=I1B5_CONLY|nr:RecName: Full=Iota-conotoxin-like L11.5 [Conus lynceus]
NWSWCSGSGEGCDYHSECCGERCCIESMCIGDGVACWP